MADKSTNSGIMYNVLATGSKIKGEFTSESDFRIDGNFEGNITCNGKIVIGQTGVFKGNLTCSNAEIMGVVEGTIRVSDTLSLKSTSKIEGEIQTKILVIEPNAIFCGTCDMKPEKKVFKKEEKAEN